MARSNLSIKNIEKMYKNFPEASYIDSGVRLLIWMIMEFKAEDPRGKNNAYRVHVYPSMEWRKMINCGTFATKEIYKIDATSGDESHPPPHASSKKKGRN